MHRRHSALIAFGICLAGCARSTPHVVATETQAPAAVPAAPAAAALVPGERSALVLLLEESDKFSAFRANTITPMLSRCATAQGVTLPAAPPRPETAEIVGGRYGGPHTDSDGVTRYGEPPAGTSADPVPSAPSAVAPDTYAKVIGGKEVARRSINRLDGTPYKTVTVGDGCYGQAVTAFFGTADAYLSFSADISQIEELANEAGAQVWQTTEVKPVVAAWVQCMTSRGFSFKSPEDPTRQDWLDPAKDKSTAEADVACRKAGNFDAAFVVAETRVQGALVAKYPGLVERVTSTMAVLRTKYTGAPLA
jgi:hypothetical protein